MDFETLTDAHRAEIWNLDAANAQMAEDISRISRDRYLMKLPSGIPEEERIWYVAHSPMQLSLVNAIIRNQQKIEELFNTWIE